MRRPRPKSTVKIADARRRRCVGEDNQPPEEHMLCDHVQRLVRLEELARSNSMELAILKIRFKRFWDKMKDIDALKEEVTSLKDEVAKLKSEREIFFDAMGL